MVYKVLFVHLFIIPKIKRAYKDKIKWKTITYC